MSLQQRFVTMEIPYLSSNPDSEHPSPLLKCKATNWTLHIASSCDACENSISSGSPLGRSCSVNVCVCIIPASKQVASIHQKAGLSNIFSGIFWTWPRHSRFCLKVSISKNAPKTISLAIAITSKSCLLATKGLKLIDFLQVLCNTTL